MLNSELTVITLKVENHMPIGTATRKVRKNGFKCNLDMQRRIDSEHIIDDNGNVFCSLKQGVP